MAKIMFITETGMFHSACRCSWGADVEWYGFKPRRHRSPAGPGMVDRSDRTAFINESATFTIDDGVLRAAVAKVAREYAARTYVVTVRDCVSFTADVARQAGLHVPRLNITPFGFIKALEFWNPKV